MSERQKKTTDKYRENYDRTFGRKAPTEDEALKGMKFPEKDQAAIDQATENNENLDRILGCEC